MFKKIIIDGKETNYSVSEDGVFINDKTGRELKGTYKSCEYRKVSLMIDGKVKTYMVHRLIAQTFIPNPDNLPVVHHIDGNKLNNNLNNLQWVTTQENVAAVNWDNIKKIESEYSEIDLNSPNWKSILDYPLYYISKEGQVYDSARKTIKVLSDRNGYKRVSLKGKLFSVHRLVYETFVGPIPMGYDIDHINGNRSDNRVENLRCVTHSENMYNAQRNGHASQCRVAQYDINNNFIKEFPSFTEAAKEMGVTYSAISSAARRGGTSCGYRWKEIK